jgi:hypothetical protein
MLRTHATKFLSLHELARSHTGCRGRVCRQETAENLQDLELDFDALRDDLLERVEDWLDKSLHQSGV